ncbi:MAG: hypothetical protein LBV08_01900 [Clostridiales bacterium]|jgi:predicted DNA-binding protein YlxM (UPF0122 family)|nr:hypothetical protein [Clostridiales bacterium]
MKDRVYLSWLYDFYSGLLTKKQCGYFEDYYFSDLSLNEVAEKFCITKQGVRESLIKTENILINYESVLNLYEKHLSRKNKIEVLCSDIDKLGLGIEIKNSLKEKVCGIDNNNG